MSKICTVNSSGNCCVQKLQRKLRNANFSFFNLKKAHEFEIWYVAAILSWDALKRAPNKIIQLREARRNKEATAAIVIVSG